MSDKVWKAQEIPQLCSANLTEEAAVHVKAIQNKIDRIMFLVDRLSISNASCPTGSQDFRILQLEVEIYVESIAANLHSLADILANIINVIILKPLQIPSDHLDSRQISIRRVRDKLNGLLPLDSVKTRYINEIVGSINQLLSLSEFQYIAAFVNTIKHRNLLDTEFQIHVQSGTLINIGFRLDPFDYDGNHFDQTQCKIVVMEYRQKVLDQIFDIGNNINNYCRAVFIMTV